MKRAALVAIAIAFVACRNAPATPEPDAATPTPSATAPKGVSDFPEDPDAPSPPRVIGPAPPTSAIPRADREKAVLDLLAGKLPARDVADAPADPGKDFDPTLRDVLSRPVPRWKVDLRDVNAKGLDAVATKRAVASKLAAIKACYRRGLARNPNLQGRIAVRLAIDAEGKATSAENAGSDVPDGEVVRCTVERVREAALPRPDAAPASAVVIVVMSSGE